MNLAKYIFDKWQKNADPRDKFKVKLFAIIFSFVYALLSTKGFVVIMGINNNILSVVVLLSFTYVLYQVFKLWCIAGTLFAIEPEEIKKENKKHGA